MEPKGRRVAVTGLGVVAPCGIGREAYWGGLLGPGITSGRSIEIDNWDPSPWYASPKDARRADRVEQFAIAATALEGKDVRIVGWGDAAAALELVRVSAAASGERSRQRDVALDLGSADSVLPSNGRAH